MTDTYNDETDFTPEPEAPRAMTLPELRKYEGQLFIMNNTPQHITFNEQIGDKKVNFELDPQGGTDSITFLPKLALDMRGLQKLWMRGSVSISTDPDMEEQIMLLNAKSVGVSEQRMRDILGKGTESQTNSNMVEKLCLECGFRDPRTDVVTRGRVVQSLRAIKAGEPPLCPEHTGLSAQFLPRLVNDRDGEHWEFDSIKMTATQR